METSMIDFQKVFGKNASIIFSECFDAKLTAIFGGIQIDILKFDEFLEKRHPDYGEEVSMKDIVDKYYPGAEKFLLI